MMLSRPIHVAATGVIASFVFMAEWYPLSICTSVFIVVCFFVTEL